MSLVFDKGKYKYYSEIDQLKLKDNINFITNQIKNTQKKYSNKNNHLYNEKYTISPFRNINNNNKNTFLTTFHNYSNMNTNYNHTNNIKNKKNINNKKLKYNKSFEGNFVNNDLLFPNNFDLNEDLYTIPHEGKNKEFNRFNNSVILNNSKQNRTKNKRGSNNKSITKTIKTHVNKNHKKNNFEDNLIKNLDEKFKSLENNIIDKKYENDIDHEEKIISTNKKNSKSSKSSKTINKNEYRNNKLSNIIDGINSNKNFVFKDDKMENIFLNIFENKNNFDIDESYLLNTSFENNRNDFNIMYTNNYGDTVMDDMLSLEIKLLIEKMIEIQKSYHKELNLILSQYNKNNEVFKLLIEKIKALQKKLYLIQKIQEAKNINGTVYNFIGIYNNNNQHEINKINKNEFVLWGKIMEASNEKNFKYDKKKIKDLFIKIIFDKYYKISGKLNDIENKIILNFMKKYNYNINKKNNLLKSNENVYGNNNKNTLFSASQVQQYKNIIRQNKNQINSQKKHKKTSSMGQHKPVKYFNSKNLKQK